ncbi:hypothetical protein J577_2738 [Acinetobacter sp. 263903-1]|nr:hypothetical protein J538_1414 [Acinetobacter sp. 272263]EXC31150.1 hypothetical protein J520_2316 [Acinetobacter sp. 869535]KCX36024.1 hypothetical protein J577_2738 [Acinetobacter sp. 263903-1]
MNFKNINNLISQVILRLLYQDTTDKFWSAAFISILIRF